jgi:hypothetical protein
MRSNKRKDEPSTEIATREKFPLQLVAATALHFLDQIGQWPHSLTHERMAISSAISFLKLCAKEIESDQESDAQHAEQLKEFERLGWKLDDIIPYKEGIKYITGQKRLDRAQEYYEAYRKNNWQLQKPLTASELTAALKKDEEKGFAARFLPLQRFVFEGSRWSGRLGLTRQRRKKTSKT